MLSNAVEIFLRSERMSTADMRPDFSYNSSQVWSPERISALGSGLWGLFGELSNQPETAILSPGFREIGVSSWWAFYQLKMYLGTRNRMRGSFLGWR